MGPKFLLLLPVWLVGSATYKARDAFRLSQIKTGVLAVLPIIIYAMFKIYLPTTWAYKLVGMRVESILGHGLDGAAQFLWAYILAILFAIHLWAIRQFKALKFFEKPFIAQPIRKMASYSFSLYIFHVPVSFFLSSYFRPEFTAPSMLQGRIPLYLASISIILVLATYTEHKKTNVRNAIKRLSLYISKKNVKAKALKYLAAAVRRKKLA